MSKSTKNGQQNLNLNNNNMNLTTNNLKKQLPKLKIENIKIKKIELNQTHETDRARSRLNDSILTQRKGKWERQSNVSNNNDLDIVNDEAPLSNLSIHQHINESTDLAFKSAVVTVKEH